MTGESVAQNLTPDSFIPFCYAVQTQSEHKKGGGLGRCEHSYWKHDQIERMINRQIPVLAKRGTGCIIDMHSGDGMETPHPQPDFFAGGSLKTTPTLAISAGRKYGCDVILCEANKARRDGLINQFGSEAVIVKNNRDLLGMHESISRYPWLIVINDPNGHGKQNVDVMQSLSEMVPVSDFVVVVNCNSIKRCLGLTDPNHPLQRVRAAYQSGVDNEWMLTPDQWRLRLGKKQFISVGPMHLSNNMEALILLVSNWIAGGAK